MNIPLGPKNRPWKNESDGFKAEKNGVITITPKFTRWWFHIFFYFRPIWGR